MFTGLVEETGKIMNILKKSSGMEITIKANKIIEKVQIGDSIAVNGVCLTVTSSKNDTFTADVMYETIERSGLKRIKTGERVNLEKSVTLLTFLGGHLIMGDVDCEAEILSVNPKGIAKVYVFGFKEKDRKNMKYIVEKGRITVDGASLTVIDTDDKNGTFSVSLIPHTIENIILGKKKVGDFVNIETDLFGKYVEKILKFSNNENSDLKNFENKENRKSNITTEFLAENGF